MSPARAWSPWALAALIEAAASFPAEAAVEEAVALEVPFLPQGRMLCGGAALAMVLRYWGEQDVYAEDFAGLVDEDKGGITTGDLVDAVRERRFLAFPLRGDGDSVRQHLFRGRPIVALLRASRNAFHYVVITGYDGEDFIIHDPSVGPNRRLPADDGKELQAKSELWMLLVLPSEAHRARTADSPSPAKGASKCADLIGRAQERPSDPGASEEILLRAAELCPGEPVVFRELSALRFREKNWSEAASWAEAAFERDPTDDHTLSLLAASLYLRGDPEGALDAWNLRGEPIIDLVEMNGLLRTRQEVLYRYLALTPGSVLTSEALRKTRRRAQELPTVGGTRASFEPLAGGRTRLKVFASERSLLESPGALVLGGAVDALAHRTARAELSSPTGAGERLETRFRWWEGRPALFVSLAAPGMLRLPGTATLEAYAERQSYSLSDGTIAEERFRGVRLSFGEWLSSSTRAELGIGYERERARGEWLALGAALERRLASDVVSLRAEASHWFSMGAAQPFDELGASIVAASGSRSSIWSVRARLDGRFVTEHAPLATWPGAGSDGVRPYLLRGYPLVEDGVVTGEGFGRRLVHASVEVERAVFRAGIVKVGVAAFLDWAHVPARSHELRDTFTSPGMGLRFDVFGRKLRVDGATALDRGGFVLSGGWVEGW